MRLVVVVPGWFRVVGLDGLWLAALGAGLGPLAFLGVAGALWWDFSSGSLPSSGMVASDD